MLIPCLIVFEKKCSFPDPNQINNLEVAILTSSSVSASWNHDKGTDLCSTIIDYIVEYTLDSPEECSGPTETFPSEVTTDTQITISGLTPFTTYTIRVSARLGMVTKPSTTEMTSITTEQTSTFCIK